MTTTTMNSNHIGLDEPLGLDDDGVEMITLVSNDGVKFELPLEYAIMSTHIKTITEECEDREIQFPRIDSTILKHIVDYLNNHKGVPGSLGVNNIKDNNTKPMEKDNLIDILTIEYKDSMPSLEVCKNDAEFADNMVARKEIYEILDAANYMHINCLIHLLSVKIALLIRHNPNNIKIVLESLNK